jgi:hypothetical protein
MDSLGLPDDLDAAVGLFHGTMFSLPLWGVVLAVWHVLTSP